MIAPKPLTLNVVVKHHGTESTAPNIGRRAAERVKELLKENGVKHIGVRVLQFEDIPGVVPAKKTKSVRVDRHSLLFALARENPGNIYVDVHNFLLPAGYRNLSEQKVASRLNRLNAFKVINEADLLKGKKRMQLKPLVYLFKPSEKDREYFPPANAFFVEIAAIPKQTSVEGVDVSHPKSWDGFKTAGGIANYHESAEKGLTSDAVVESVARGIVKLLEKHAGLNVRS
ncbi:MAG: hypothetical protein V1817_01415 [Candidatus Micrarchaeota archaeon]